MRRIFNWFRTLREEAKNYENIHSINYIDPETGLPDGAVYSGEVLDSKYYQEYLERRSKMPELKWPGIYSPNKSVRHGKGVHLYKSGGKYEGEWEYDLCHGNGLYMDSGGNKYEGEWQYDLKHGFGILAITDGDRYKGEFKKDKKNGKGIQVFPNGDTYEGEYQDDSFEGNGVFTTSNGKLYKPLFKDKKPKNSDAIYVLRTYYNSFMTGDKLINQIKNLDFLQQMIEKEIII